MKNAAVYVRVSVDRPEETSTTTQADRCREYAERQGWSVVDVYEDRGRSAFKSTAATRPGLARLLADVDAGVVDVVIVWKLDRWARSLQEFVRLRQRLEDAGAEWASVTDSFDTSTPMGRGMLGVVAVFAELESGIKSERITEWHRHRNATGAPPAAPPPFGYRSDWTIDEDKAERIRQAVDAILDGESMRQVVMGWNRDGVETSQGNAWSRRGFTKLLRSPTLAGLRMVDGVAVEGEWTPILARDRWEAIVTLLDDPARRTNTGAPRKLLSGIAHCAECGARMGHRGHKAGPRYTCRHTGEDMSSCGRISIQADIADEYVRDAIVAAVGAGLPNLTPPGDPELVARLESELSELAGDYGRGTITRAEWQAARQGLERRLSEATDALARSTSTIPVDLESAWETMDTEARRSVILTVIERVDVAAGYGKADRLSIVWRV